MANNTFPSDWREQPCVIAVVPLPLVPYVAGLTKIMENRGFWASEEDYVAGYQAVIELGECLMATCVQDLIESNDRLYRMLNTAIFGVTYATVSTDPLVVTPAIAPHVTLDIHNEDSLLGRIYNLTQLMDNRLAGTDTPNYSGDGIKQQLQAILDAIAADDTDIEAILAAAQQIALLVA